MQNTNNIDDAIDAMMDRHAPTLRPTAYGTIAATLATLADTELDANHEAVVVLWSDTGRIHAVEVHGYSWLIRSELDPFYGSLTPADHLYQSRASESYLCG